MTVLELRTKLRDLPLDMQVIVSVDEEFVNVTDLQLFNGNKEAHAVIVVHERS